MLFWKKWWKSWKRLARAKAGGSLKRIKTARSKIRQQEGIKFLFGPGYVQGRSGSLCLCDYHIKKIVEKVAFNLKFVPASAKLYIYVRRNNNSYISGNNRNQLLIVNGFDIGIETDRSSCRRNATGCRWSQRWFNRRAALKCWGTGRPPAIVSV